MLTYHMAWVGRWAWPLDLRITGGWVLTIAVAVRGAGHTATPGGGVCQP